MQAIKIDQVQAVEIDKVEPLRVDGVYKSYGSKVVLENVSLGLNKGELFGLIGLNGVGKTTLIKIILDLAKADQGTAHIFGNASDHVNARENLSYLPEKFQPSSYLTGYEYLSLTMDYYGKALDREAARELAETLDLDPNALARRVSSYSKGMGQKIGLMGAFLTEQPLLILDEPMSGLDPLARIKLKDKLLSLKSAGQTIFFSSHILADIDEICDRIGVIHNTSLVFLGTPAEFRETYKQTSLEQAFLKAINS